MNPGFCHHSACMICGFIIMDTLNTSQALARPALILTASSTNFIQSILSSIEINLPECARFYKRIQFFLVHLLAQIPACITLKSPGISLFIIN